MRFKAFCILVVLLGFSAVVSRAAVQPPAPAAGLENIEKKCVATKPENPDSEGACVQWRQIGFLKKGVKDGCPAADGWEEPHSLLKLALLEANKKTEEEIDQERNAYLAQEGLPKPQMVRIKPADRAQLRKLGLDRVCVYEAEAPGEPNLKSLPPQIKPKPDRLALSTTSAGGLPMDSLSQAVWQALAIRFRDQTLQSDANGPSRVPIPLPVEPSVRLTFIDSQPDGEGFPLAPHNGSPHGFTLAYLARGMVCPVPERCAALVVTRRALSFGDFTPRAVMPSNELPSDQSGHVGLMSDLAVKIVAEVLYWRHFDPDKKLILNLSLGWDGELFGDLKKHKLSKLDPSVQAVYKALRFARRSGALVIAAAGNQRGGKVPSNSPLLPAAWELKRPTWLPFFLSRKPVYAVGGVDGQRMPLSNSRRGGLPRRATYADHAVAATEDPNDPTALYTGTSVSAAVASSIAAMVWHLRPDLSPSEVMRLVTRSGDPLPFRADFYPWKKLWPLSKILKAPHARRLSLCRAAESACGPDGSRCLALSSLPACSDPPAPSHEIEAILRSLPATKSSASPSLSPPELVDVASQRWVTPQPEATPCPSCALVPEPSGFSAAGARLVLEISNDWDPEQKVLLTGATLYIDGSPSYELTHDQVVRGSVHRISVAAGGRLLRARSAQITFMAKDIATGEPMSILNPVLVVEPVAR